MSGTAKQEIITFKADRALAEAMRGVPNRSEFIRTAVLAALENGCPLCRGTGVLTTAQKRHWQTFASHHGVEECGDCHAWHLVCEHEGGAGTGGERLPAARGSHRRRAR